MIAKECGGIYPPFEAFYIQSIIYAAGRAEDAFQRFDRAASSAEDHELIVATVQEALTHAAAISRFLWSFKKSELAAARAQKLREAFGIDDTSPLRNRKLRNAFEHFDDDLDQFLLDDRVGTFFPAPMVGDHRLADDQLSTIFKLVDPSSGVCVVLGEKYDFDLIRAEVQRILAGAKIMQQTGFRLRQPETEEGA